MEGREGSRGSVSIVVVDWGFLVDISSGTPVPAMPGV